jgi:hypothetical protein
MTITAQTFLLHNAYDHAPNALVPLLLTAVGDVDNNEQHPQGRDRLEGGGQCPPTAAAIVLVVIIDYGSGGMGADDQRPMAMPLKYGPRTASWTS